MKSADYKCLQSGVRECCCILAWCPWAHNCCPSCLTVATDGIIKYKRSCSVNSTAHCTPCVNHMVSYLLQRPLWTCFC